MTVDAGFLQQDPVSAFLDRDPVALEDPTVRFLQDGPNDFAAPPDEDEKNKILRAAIGIGAAFVIYRTLMSDRMPNRLPDDPKVASGQIYRLIKPQWLRAALPGLLEAYRLGSTSKLTPNELTRLAQGYAETLGDYIHESSTEALVKGVDMQLAQGWSERVAWERVREGYGLDASQMRSYLMGLARANSGSAAVTTVIPEASKAAVRTALLIRAERLGQNEAWVAMQSGQALGWLYLEKKGVLTGDPKKRWVTAEDEMVCPVCAPLHRKEVGLEERFETPDGRKFFAPGVHPNCRCRLELVTDLPETVYKAMTRDGKFDPRERDAKGQFARTESRQRRNSPPPVRFVEPDFGALGVAVLDRPEAAVATPAEVDQQIEQALEVMAPQRINQAQRIDQVQRIGGVQRIESQQAQKIGVQRIGAQRIGAQRIGAEQLQETGTPDTRVKNKPRGDWSNDSYWMPVRSSLMEYASGAGELPNQFEPMEWVSEEEIDFDDGHVMGAAAVAVENWQTDFHDFVLEASKGQDAYNDLKRKFVDAEAERVLFIARMVDDLGLDTAAADEFAYDYALAAQGGHEHSANRDGPFTLAVEEADTGQGWHALGHAMKDRYEYASDVQEAFYRNNNATTLVEQLAYASEVKIPEDYLWEHIYDDAHEHEMNVNYAIQDLSRAGFEAEVFMRQYPAFSIVVFPNGLNEETRAGVDDEEAPRLLRGEYELGLPMVASWNSTLVPPSLREMISKAIPESRRKNMASPLMIRMHRAYPAGQVPGDETDD